jgi:CTP synthase
MKEKIALFCNVPKEAVIEALDEPTIYKVPLSLYDQHFDTLVMDRLSVKSEVEPDLEDWRKVVQSFCNPDGEVEIAMVGKYINHKDAYLSVVEALNHAGVYHKVRIRIRSVEAEAIEEQGAEKVLAGVHGVLVPGGFGARGLEGKIEAARYAREKKIPYLGLCLGMQVAVIDFARHVCGISDANTAEVQEDGKNLIIHLMEEQRDVADLGGTMRLGAYPCALVPGTKSFEAYHEEVVYERHRHRYEFNNEYRDLVEKAGLKVAGVYKKKDLVEIVEISDHPWFIAVQFHPEFRSRPVKPHPLFVGFIQAAVNMVEK